jgi:phage I-like protein
MTDNCCQTSFAACIFEIASVERELQLLPAGKFHARDGRPTDAPSWYIDGALAQRVIAAAQARANPFLIDYEHQTLNAEKNGQAAPASGWWDAKSMEWREGKGLFAVNVEWTDKARAMIAAGEYKFFSPVFKYDKQTGAVTAILMGAITNYPALDGMEALAARAAARFSTQPEQGSKEGEISAEELAVCHLMGLEQDEYIKSRAASRKHDSAFDLATTRVGQPDRDGEGGLSAEELSVCRSMGLPPHEYKKNRAR